MARIFGIDTSQVQGTPDYSKVATYHANVGGQVRFEYHKATEGANFTDPKFKANLAASRAAGIPFQGAYQFFRPAQDPVRQLEYFYQATNALGARDGELPPMLDLESMGNLKGPDALNAALLWLTLAEAYFGKVPVIYTGAYFWEGLGSYARLPEFSRYPIFLAQYPIDPVKYPGPAKTYEPAEDKGPRVPAPWKTWTMWQYAGNGSKPVDGIRGAVDRDLFNGTEEELMALCAGGIGFGPDDPQHPKNRP